MDKENFSPIAASTLPIITMEELQTPIGFSRKRHSPTSSEFSNDSKRSKPSSSSSEDLSEYLTRKKTSPTLYAGSKRSTGTQKDLPLSAYKSVKAEMKKMSPNELSRFVDHNPELAGKADRLFKKLVRSQFPDAQTSETIWKAEYEKLKAEESKKNSEKEAMEAAEKKQFEEEKLARLVEKSRKKSARVVPVLPSTHSLQETLRAVRLREANEAKKRNGAEEEPKTNKKKRTKRTCRSTASRF